MGLVRYAGKLLRRAVGGLHTACCCVKYWCVPSGTYCDMLWYTCLQDPQADPRKYGPYESDTCNNECIPLEPCWEPTPYYCCYSGLDEYGQPVGGTYCNAGPCPSLALTSSGPHQTQAECEYNCQKHACVPAACNQCVAFEPSAATKCVPDPNGPYLTAAKCRESCGCVSACALYPCPPRISFSRNPPSCGNYDNIQVGDAATGPYWRTGGQTPADGTSLVFWVEYDANKPICVAYTSLNGKPIRVQITEPRQTCATYAGNVNEAIRRDSGWRGSTGCDCPSERAGGGALGSPKGTLKWNTKKQNVGWFHVRVFAPCYGSQWKIGVGCDCPTIPTADEPCCDCSQCAISWSVTDDDTTQTVSGASPCFDYRLDGILRTTRLPAAGEITNIQWKAGWPAAAGCRPNTWVESGVACYNSAIGPVLRSLVPGNCSTTQTAAASYAIWRYFVCENGVMVNRTNDAVTAADIWGVTVSVSATSGGHALALPVYIAWDDPDLYAKWNGYLVSGPAGAPPPDTDPTGQPGGCCGGAVACPTAVDAVTPLDPLIVC